MISYHKKLNTGFILIYVIIISAVIVAIIGLMVNSALTETNISRDAGEALKAFFAADSGIECVEFLQKSYQAFDSTSPPTTYNCGLGLDFTAGSGDAVCQDVTYTFILDGFSNGSCAKVTASSVPKTILIDGSSVVICMIRVQSEGKNSCSDANVEITRWANI